MNKNLSNIIEITDSHIKWLQGRWEKSKPLVTAWDIQPIKTPSDDELARVLESMAESKGKHAGTVTGILPRRFVIVKSFRFPSKDDQEIRKMVSLQLAQQIPYNLDDVIFKIQSFEKDVSGYTRANVFIVHKDVADRYYQIFEKAGLNLNELVLSSQGLLELMKVSRGVKASKEVEACLNLDASHSEICFFRDNSLMYSRHVNLGMRDLKGEKLLELVNQAAASFQSFRKEHSVRSIPSLYLLTSLKDNDQLQNDLKAKTQAVASVIDPSSLAQWDKKNVMANVNEGSLSVCLGFLNSKSSTMLNFIPSKASEKRQSALKKNRLAQLGVSFSILFILLGGVFGVKYQAKHSYLTFLQKKNSQQQENLFKAQQQMESVQFFRQEIKSRILVADLMEEIIRLMPPEVSLRSLQFDSSEAFSIQGYAQEGPGVNVLQEGMGKSSFLKEVNLQFATKRRIFDRDVTDFKITARIKTDQ